MTGKVIGCYEKDAELHNTSSDSNIKSLLINKSKLVPVRLRKESVGLKWLEKYCRIVPSNSLTQYEIGYKQAFKDLLCAVRAKAGDGKK